MPADFSIAVDPDAHATLVDMRSLKIQSRESVVAFMRLLGDRVHASRVIAFVVERSLARAQIQRAAAGRSADFFLSSEEAEDWLRGQNAPSTSKRGERSPAARGTRPAHGRTSSGAGVASGFGRSAVL